MFLHSGLENPGTPTGSRFVRAFKESVYDPSIWFGLASMSVIALSGEEKNIVYWASGTTPLFGSQERAEQISDYLRYVSLGTTALIYSFKNFPREEWDPRDAAFNAAAAGAATTITASTTLGLKYSTSRLRPDSSDTHSFLSGHTSIAAVSNTLSFNMLEGVSLPRSYRAFSRCGLTALTAATAWARLEAGKHYPSDVIAAAVLGRFIANLTYRTIMGPYSPKDSRIDLFITPDMLELRLAFSL
ncbi:hypothetical protein CHISP_2007 [Chitinispirillum alkaliphilum]|nr:hypothetical protein CHISP_2007 [Chitinispirillum alkaliphilum]